MRARPAGGMITLYCRNLGRWVRAWLAGAGSRVGLTTRLPGSAASTVARRGPEAANNPKGT